MFNELSKTVGNGLFTPALRQPNEYLSEEAAAALSKPSTGDECARFQGHFVVTIKIVDELVDKFLWKRKRKANPRQILDISSSGWPISSESSSLYSICAYGVRMRAAPGGFSRKAHLSAKAYAAFFSPVYQAFLRKNVAFALGEIHALSIKFGDDKKVLVGGVIHV